MAGIRISHELLYRVATAYYIDKKQQREIANELKVSRVQISKYLKMAEEYGLIRIEIIPPVINMEELLYFQQEFKKTFSIKDILVCPSYNTHDTLLRSLIKQAENYIWRNYGTGGLIVGLGWGKTALELTENLQTVEHRHWQIVPLAGGNNRVSEKYYNINYLVQTFAEKIGAKSYSLYLPLIFDTRTGHQSIIQSHEFRHISKFWNAIDLIICSLGSDLAGSPLFKYETKDPKYLNNLKEAKAVGDMLMHFYDIDGKIVELGIEDRMIKISYQQLMEAKNRLVIVSGIEKTDAILGALRANFIDILIIDRSTAIHILERNKQV
jgi:DNA-binding transcriptional regulator LsrR (DeoR family)